MRLTDLERSLAEVSNPYVSVYLEPTANRSARARSTVNSHPWLRKLAKSIEAGMPATERDSFRTQLNRIEAFLRSPEAGNGALAIFSAPGKWVCLHLPPAISNELSWGKPSLQQLRRVAQEEQGVCIVAVDRAGARFFRYELGDLAELPEMKFELDVSQWKRKEHGHMARRDTKMPHGPLRDAFKRRMDEQYHRFFRHIAERTKFVCAKENLHVVMLVGSERITKPIESVLPREIRERTVLIPQDLARVAPIKLQAKILPKISQWMRRFSGARAARLIESTRGTVIGFDETLAELQSGRVGSLLVVRGLDVPLRQCVNCGDVNRSADPVCAVCGGPRRSVTLSQVLDALAKEHHTKVEVLDPDAAKALAKAGGMGGWLRQPSLVAAR
jgi:hypothetical protein